MRRYAVVMIVVGLVAALAAPAPAARRTRTVKKAYDSDPTKGGFSAWVDNRYVIFVGDSVGIPTRSGERSVSLTVTDDSGIAIAAGAWQADGDVTLFCTRSGQIPIKGGKPVWVRPVVEITPTGGVCDQPAPTTTGTVTAKIR